MINRQTLLQNLHPLLKLLESDLRQRCADVPAIDTLLNQHYQLARAANRTAFPFESWRTDLITQVAVAWILSSVFVRFLEDNALLFPPCISGPLQSATPDAGLQRARDQRDLYFQAHPLQTDRDYLLSVFDQLAQIPATASIFGPHNIAVSSDYRAWLSGDAAQKIIEFFQNIDTDGTGQLLHDFTDDAWDTRFLGDLYQDLSEATRKKYALLQTPIFIEDFILQRTAEPAIAEFGLPDFKLIDPACGSGHFLLGAFAHILQHWRTAEPATTERELVNRALKSIYGVDLNPYAAAIARFRLLLAAMRQCHITRLSDAPAFNINIVCGDSLLHGSPGTEQTVLDFHELAHVYQSEDLPELQRILTPGQYHAVVANPPYITVKDSALNQAYRDRYPEVCYRQYSLSVPFLQRIFSLACPGGFTGQITANSFMKREFGKKLVESYLPKMDLTHLIDTSGAYIPGHGTPTVILFGRNRPPVAPAVRAVLGIKGEPSTPADPAHGQVWSAILHQIDRVGSQSDFISVNDTPRSQLAKHPWSIGGGGAAEIKTALDAGCPTALNGVTSSIGRTCSTQGDEIFINPAKTADRQRIPPQNRRGMVIGDTVRDWRTDLPNVVLFPYDDHMRPIAPNESREVLRFLWRAKTTLASTLMFGNRTKVGTGLNWFEYGQWIPNKLSTPLSITFAFVATHNHFVLDRGGKVFNRSAPVIKLAADATEDDHLALLGLLNSSTACFWMKQVFHNKGSTVDQAGARQRTAPFEDFFEYDGTKLLQFPLPADRPLALAKQIDSLARELSSTLPAALCAAATPTAAALATAQQNAARLHAQMITLQEELDWQCYGLYGLLENPPLAQNPPPLNLGQRAFEIILARKLAAGEEQSAWFTRHNSTPITTIPTDWPADYQQLIQQRMDIIESDPNIALIERPEYKRRWNMDPGDQQQHTALQNWLLDRLESYFDLDGRMNDQHHATARANLTAPQLTTLAQLADIARADTDFMSVAELFTARPDFNIARLVEDLVAAESVPALPVLRYKPSGLEKRAVWERTWELQRQEDRLQSQIDALEQQIKRANTASQPTAALESQITALKSQLPNIPVPPKYTAADFLSGTFWLLRGKLDVPKERWTTFPHCPSPDGSLTIAWAGYDHLQLARAIAERYETAKQHEGLKIEPLLAAIAHLIPWLKQWHNDLDPTHAVRMGDYFAGYLAEESKALGQSPEQIITWSPPAQPRRTRRQTNPQP